MAGLVTGPGAMDRSEMFSWYTKVSPPTPLEEEWKDKIDPIDLEIFFHKTSMIVYTGKEVMVKVGTTPGMTGTDLNCAIYTADGDVAVSGMGVYVHALSGQGPIKYFKRHYEESVGVNDGDLLYVTDPYLGGTHVNDQFLVAPVFADGQLVAWVASGCHQTEIGAVDVGMSPTSKNRYGDGMLVSTIKIGENLTLRDDLVSALANMNRDPQSWILDLKARYAAIVHMRDEVIKLAQKKGTGFVVGGLRKLIEDTMELASKKVSKYNDGTYRGVIFLDTIGDKCALLRICFSVTKKGDTLTLDFSGTSPQVPGAVNSYNFCMPGAVVMYTLPYVFHDLPTSLGVLHPIKDYKMPPKSFINPDVEASTSLCVFTLFALYTVLHQVFSKMIFDSPDREVVTAPQGWAVDGSQSVVLNQRGLINGCFITDVNAMGQGGRQTEDGPHSMNASWAAMADSLETEWFEKDLPYLFLFRKHAVDSGGAGKYRGGCGMESAFFAHNIQFGLTTSVGAGVKTPGCLGLFGGYGMTNGPGVFVWKSNVEELIKDGKPLPKSRQEVIEMVDGERVISSKNMPMRNFSTGDVLTTQNCGGGGYGDVLERDPHLVIEDLRTGVISHWMAEKVYQIAYDKTNLILHEERTEKLRKAERKKRARRGKPYEAFMREWAKLKPKNEVLEHFGPWPGLT